MILEGREYRLNYWHPTHIIRQQIMDCCHSLHLKFLFVSCHELKVKIYIHYIYQSQNITMYTFRTWHVHRFHIIH